VRLFTPLLEESYVSNIEGYKGEKILYGCEIQEQDFAEVDTKLSTSRGENLGGFTASTRWMEIGKFTMLPSKTSAW